MTRSAGQPERPVIQVFTALTGASGEYAAVTRDVLAGIEEEGVPYAVTTVAEDVPVADLARRAAMRSPLQVGVGIGAGGGVCVHHDMLEDPLPELSSADPADSVAARMLGHNAARIVVGLPLKPD
ncbi:glycerol dehydratase reactivase beta/small subunit family protein [Mycolicibacterium smegmatis]|uniref:glycerol dehydratase reactivase beta/small subunit family protein n=1 Tax=Mycolicibacterium smegmatis TaxID=1772 RepID=UPI001CBBF9D7|nr:glycerol dehydratase reactivase beta/small subunit family protein [Mycolicibacterium smegmatis]MDF1899413.1 glycerol dehydratase reactivase beta/small subunit family protein [Mycolicibacterium smegmatis]MDF1905711.1 glycerol dehydratase reactivase beta/small subunit family protein [Mycolicibacterium smegmatis]MDF1918121.1 glycerol dehydratase reactivase beta/small subunit family protein [Mycolicibacterium smegmatis]MDF1924298.1 glycerol dehydratase reactivase beta/small subunit family protei